MQLGKYELQSKLATGGMAEVFLARAAGPMGFEKTLVVKRILPQMAEDPSFVEMFLGEAKLVARLNHPNIVQIFDFGEADGEYFLAMEYIDGPNLRTLRRQARALGVPLPPNLCARIASSACEGLAFAHDFQDPATGKPLKLIHRDVSSDNILLSRQGAVKVVDFGIAKAVGQTHKTQTGLIRGKLAYMPPEQIQAMPLDRRIDVYALGIVLYELLTGEKPFDAPTDAALMQAILFKPMVPAVERRPDLPRPLQLILERALAKDREQRYPDCRALQADLEDFILSTGKAVGPYQIAQFIAQTTPASGDTSPTTPSGEQAAPSLAKDPEPSGKSRKAMSEHRRPVAPSGPGAPLDREDPNSTVRNRPTPRPIRGEPDAAPDTDETIRVSQKVASPIHEQDTLPLPPRFRPAAMEIKPKPPVARNTEPRGQEALEAAKLKSQRQWLLLIVIAALLAAAGGYFLAGLNSGPRDTQVKTSGEE